MQFCMGLLLTFSKLRTNLADDKLIFFLFLLKIRFDISFIFFNLHELSNSIFWENKKKIFQNVVC